MEMKFYEMIGVRQWKKFVLWLMAQFIRNPKYRKGANYYLAGIDLKSVIKFKKMLIFNGMIHLCGVLCCIFFIIINITENKFISFATLWEGIWFFENLYCIMLQRYNWLRIKKVLKKVAHK